MKTPVALLLVAFASCDVESVNDLDYASPGYASFDTRLDTRGRDETQTARRYRK